MALHFHSRIRDRASYAALAAKASARRRARDAGKAPVVKPRARKASSSVLPTVGLGLVPVGLIVLGCAWWLGGATVGGGEGGVAFAAAAVTGAMLTLGGAILAATSRETAPSRS